jgi:nucleoside-diphosphate-sugar epimerase
MVMSMAATDKQKSQTIDVVTGATSSLGVHLVRELLKRGDEVRVIVKDNPKVAEDWRTLPAGCIPYIADITLKDEGDKDVIKSACAGVNNIFHLAAATYNYKYRYQEMIDTNVIGTENVLRAYLEANTQKNAEVQFIFTSSVTVYGYSRAGEELTEDSDTRPTEGYSETKLMAEKVIQSFAAADPRIKYTIFRIGTMYGEGYESEFYKVFKLLKGRSPKYIGDARNHLTIVDVNDVTKAMILSCGNAKSFDRIYNITDGIAYTQKDLFDKAAQFLGVQPPSRGLHPMIAKIGARMSGLNYDEFEFLVSDRMIRIDRAKKELGYRPSCSIDVEGKQMAKSFIKTS